MIGKKEKKNDEREKNQKKEKEKINMKHIMEHYGTAILTGVVLVALGVTLVAFAKSSFITTQFEGALTGFFSNMGAI